MMNIWYKLVNNEIIETNKCNILLKKESESESKFREAGKGVRRRRRRRGGGGGGGGGGENA